MRERYEGAESPGAHVDNLVSRGNFCLALCSIRPPSNALVDYHQERGGMPLRDTIEASSTCAKGCMVDDCV